MPNTECKYVRENNVWLFHDISIIEQILGKYWEDNHIWLIETKISILSSEQSDAYVYLQHAFDYQDSHSDSIKYVQSSDSDWSKQDKKWTLYRLVAFGITHWQDQVSSSTWICKKIYQLETLKDNFGSLTHYMFKKTAKIVQKPSSKVEIANWYVIEIDRWL